MKVKTTVINSGIFKETITGYKFAKVPLSEAEIKALRTVLKHGGKWPERSYLPKELKKELLRASSSNDTWLNHIEQIFEDVLEVEGGALSETKTTYTEDGLFAVLVLSNVQAIREARKQQDVESAIIHTRQLVHRVMCEQIRPVEPLLRQEQKRRVSASGARKLLNPKYTDAEKDAWLKQYQRLLPDSDHSERLSINAAATAIAKQCKLPETAISAIRSHLSNNR